MAQPQVFIALLAIAGRQAVRSPATTRCVTQAASFKQVRNGLQRGTARPHASSARSVATILVPYVAQA